MHKTSKSQVKRFLNIRVPGVQLLHVPRPKLPTDVGILSSEYYLQLEAKMAKSLVKHVIKKHFRMKTVELESAKEKHISKLEVITVPIVFKNCHHQLLS
jgi:glutaredoxin